MRRQTRGPVDLHAGPFGVVEVDPDGVAVGDHHVDADPDIPESPVKPDDILQSLAAESDLLKPKHAGRNRPPGANHQLVVFRLGPCTEEDHALAGSSSVTVRPSTSR